MPQIQEKLLLYQPPTAPTLAGAVGLAPNVFHLRRGATGTASAVPDTRCYCVSIERM